MFRHVFELSSHSGTLLKAQTAYGQTGHVDANSDDAHAPGPYVRREKSNIKNQLTPRPTVYRLSHALLGY